MKNDDPQWLAIGTLSFFGVAALGSLLLHSARGLPWSVLALPVLGFAALQEGFCVGMFWATKTNSPRMAAFIAGTYLVSSGSMMIHYGSKWSLLKGLGDKDILWFSIAMAISTFIGAAVLRQKPR
ncbi:MAG TPA: hypothetical protein VNE63_22945 [Candidatus Acidoferrales bacterium]|nr:hypothetical protein [Candidatus Acidoferrales bacterium]